MKSSDSMETIIAITVRVYSSYIVKNPSDIVKLLLEAAT